MNSYLDASRSFSERNLQGALLLAKEMKDDLDASRSFSERNLQGAVLLAKEKMYEQ